MRLVNFKLTNEEYLQVGAGHRRLLAVREASNVYEFPRSDSRATMGQSLLFKLMKNIYSSFLYSTENSDGVGHLSIRFYMLIGPDTNYSNIDDIIIAIEILHHIKYCRVVRR